MVLAKWEENWHGSIKSDASFLTETLRLVFISRVFGWYFSNCCHISFSSSRYGILRTGLSELILPSKSLWKESGAPILSPLCTVSAGMLPGPVAFPLVCQLTSWSGNTCKRVRVYCPVVRYCARALWITITTSSVVLEPQWLVRLLCSLLVS